MSNSSENIMTSSPSQWWWNTNLDSPQHLDAWLWSVAASGIIGLAGVVPLLVIPINYSNNSSQKDGKSDSLQLLLSFAVGGLLGDVFLHLLPEAWGAALQAGLSPHEAFTRVGLCVLFGIFVFIVVEMLASAGEEQQPPEFDTTTSTTTPINNNNNDSLTNSIDNNNINNKTKEGLQARGGSEGEGAARKIEVVGYLNLLANGIDNFAHGLAVAGSFMVSYKTGLLTTIAILIHEVPHEIGDFAILLSSGFSRWEAAKAQLYTAFIGLLGALFTLSMGSSSVVDGIQLYILGFTSGAFLNISLVSVLPQLLHEERPLHSAAQMAMLLLGTYVMASVAC